MKTDSIRNRAGVPLIEVVGDPDLRSSAQAAQYMRALVITSYSIHYTKLYDDRTGFVQQHFGQCGLAGKGMPDEGNVTNVLSGVTGHDWAPAILSVFWVLGG